MPNQRAPAEVKKENTSLRDFQGINTQAARQVIGDNQFAWIENVMPIGFGNMPALPGPSASLATWSGTAYHMRQINIASVDYKIVFTSNGAVYAINLSSLAVTTVAAAATLSGAGSDVAQWSNTHAIIVDANGYFTWDGSTFTKQNGTLASLTVSVLGTGYTSSPTLGGFNTGGGSGGAGTAHIQVGQAVLAVGGATYSVGDVLTVVTGAGTAVRAAQLAVSAVAAGVITGFNLIDAGDYTVAPGNPVATTSPYGTGATFTLNFGIGPLTLTAAGSGYTSAPTITVTGGAGAGGAVTANLTVVPGGGTSVATFAGRVWVASNRTVAFSGPGSFNDFSAASAGGSFIMTDENLVGAIKALRAANNFLYIVGTSSVNVVSDVSVVNGATVFSNPNVSASIGTDFQDSIVPYYRGLWFANQHGVYVLYGSTTQKMSDDLDGIFSRLLNSTTGVKISGGLVVLYKILCVAFMLRYDDPVLGSRSIVAAYFNKKWFLSSQGGPFVTMDASVISGAQALYATDGTHLYKLMSDATIPVDQIIVTKLWDMGATLNNKQAMKFGIEINNPAALQTFTGTVDTEYASGAVDFAFDNANSVDWINNSNAVVQWSNSGGVLVDWMSTGYAFLPLNVETSGRYLGVTLNSTSVRTLYEGVHMQHEDRTPWPQGGAQ